MTSDTIALTLYVNAGSDADSDRLDQATRQLLAEIRELDVEAADLMTATLAPVGAKAGEAITAGALVLAVLPSIIPKLIDVVQNWVTRRPNHTIKIRSEIAGRAVEVEFSPRAMSVDELKTWVDTVTKTLEK